MYSPAWPHSGIKEIFPNVFFVTGTNKTNYNGVDLQHSRNMIIIRDKDKLSLINSVRLTDSGIAELNTLGKVENIIRIGAFHGRDDAFYIDTYKAKLWALKDMQHDNNKVTDIELKPNGIMPFPNAALLVFETSIYPEGVLYLDQEGGILITCDSIKNWVTADEFFSLDTANLYKQQGYFGSASISDVWLNACKVKPADFTLINSLKFHHLLSAHGEPLLNNAHEQLKKTIASL
jgi:hypothetical protein